MTRDELVAELAQAIAQAEGFISPADDGHDVARAVLDRIEALGWGPRAEQYRAGWMQASRDALHWREVAEKATEEVEHLRRELTARGLGRVAERADDIIEVTTDPDAFTYPGGRP